MSSPPSALAAGAYRNILELLAQSPADQNQGPGRTRIRSLRAPDLIETEPFAHPIDGFFSPLRKD